VDNVQRIPSVDGVVAHKNAFKARFLDQKTLLNVWIFFQTRPAPIPFLHVANQANAPMEADVDVAVAIVSQALQEPTAAFLLDAMAA
jgi:hypothetical protein